MADTTVPPRTRTETSLPAADTQDMRQPTFSPEQIARALRAANAQTVIFQNYLREVK